VIAKKIPDALNILDRFHIMKKFNEGLDNVRSTETTKLLCEKNVFQAITEGVWHYFPSKIPSKC
jgi:transposase